MQKGFAPILLLVGILILATIAGGAYYFSTKNFSKSTLQPTIQTSQPQNPSPTTNPTAYWKTYTDAKNGYEIKYPNDKLTSCSSTIQGFPDTFDLRLDKECLISEPGIIIQIQVFDAPHPELTSPYPQCYTYTKEHIKIGQIDGNKYSPVIKKSTGECVMTSYGVTDTIEFDHNTKHFSIRAFNSEDLNYSQILSTFKFL